MNNLTISHVIAALAVSLAATTGFAQSLATPAPAREGVAGEIVEAAGLITVIPLGGQRRIISKKSAVYEGDYLMTESNARARIRFTDGATVDLLESTELKIENYHYNAADTSKDGFFTRLGKGTLRAITGLVGKRSKDKVKFETATATIGIRGTTLMLSSLEAPHQENIKAVEREFITVVTVTDGLVQMDNDKGGLLVPAGQSAASMGRLRIPDTGGIGPRTPILGDTPIPKATNERPPITIDNRMAPKSHIDALRHRENTGLTPGSAARPDEKGCVIE